MTTHLDIEELRRIEIFAACEDAALHELMTSSETRILRGGDVLYGRGDAAEGGFLLIKGAIMLRAREDGRGEDKVVGPLTLLGEAALIAPTTRSTTAQAREASTVLTIPRELFHHILERHPQSAAQVRQLFKNRIARLSKSIKLS